ncbi:MAG: hypothetical protein M1831_002673 [Alyxoria varia]|nr:MAG: hypothetical protein M1831_002673 [Alyxoria varia]
MHDANDPCIDNKEAIEPVRVLIIGAGSRGNAYARAIDEATNAVVAAVAEPEVFQREQFGQRYIWKHDTKPGPGQEFADWKEFCTYEQSRRRRAAAAGRNGGVGEEEEEEEEEEEPGVDAAVVCVLDDMHRQALADLAPLQLHILSEKPLSTSLSNCLDIYSSLMPGGPSSAPQRIFGIASPTSDERPHLPSTIVSTGRLSYFRKARKPRDAGAATNCLSCPSEQICLYSAKKIYVERHLRQGNTGWPVKIVEPEIEDHHRKFGMVGAQSRLLERLSEDYDDSTPQQQVDSRPWFGRCVWEASNDVCDDQTVTLSWEDEDDNDDDDDDDDDDNDNDKNGRLTPHSEADVRYETVKRRGRATITPRLAKTATFHMIAHTDDICQRRGRVYGTHGEIAYDSKTIQVYDFATGESQKFHPSEGVGGHGGGDRGLVEHFIRAVEDAKTGRLSAEEAQRRHIGCTLDDVIRSHALVFAAEEARRDEKVVKWRDWWNRKVEKPMAVKTGDQKR